MTTPVFYPGDWSCYDHRVNPSTMYIAHIKNKTIVVVIMLSFVFAVPVNAQFQSKNFSDNYNALAQKETSTMNTRYHLSTSQLAKVGKLNTTYYGEINTALQQNMTDRQVRKERVRVIRENREKQLQTLFTKEQYKAYRKDMDAVELKAKQRADELNKNAIKQRIRLKN